MNKTQDKEKEQIIINIGITLIISIILLILYSDILIENISLNHILMIIGLSIVVNPLQKKIGIIYQKITDKKYIINMFINLLITIFTCLMIDILHFFNIMVFIKHIPVTYKLFLFILLFIMVLMISKLGMKIYSEKKIEVLVKEYSYLFGIISFFIYEYWFNLIVENSIMYSSWNYMIYRISIIGGLVIFWGFCMFILKKIILKINFEKIFLVIGTLTIFAVIGFIILIKILSVFHKIERLF